MRLSTMVSAAAAARTVAASRTSAVALTAAALVVLSGAATPAHAADADIAVLPPDVDAVAPAAGHPAAVVVEIFRDVPICFSPDGPPAPPPQGVTLEENGRVVTRTVVVSPPDWPHRTFVRVSTAPVPKDETSVCDPWDRAGSVRLATPASPDIELLKFITAYGGVTEHEADVTHLSSALEGSCTFRAFVDTWLSPAWTMSLSLEFRSAEEWELRDANATPSVADWYLPVLFEQDATAASLGELGYETEVDVPDGIERVELCYLSSGHCTDGRDEDEFVSKDNVISVDGVVVERFRPWRDDCRRFRDVNPYTRRWSDGWWSSDYSRSGWCPGDQVPPMRFDLSDHLGPGHHAVSFNVENVRPSDGEHHGYWRLSAYLVGWRVE